MKLILRLSNQADRAGALREILRFCPVEVLAEEDHLSLSAELLVSGEIDIADSSAVSAIWQRTHEFIAIINGCAAVEGLPLARIVLDNILYVDEGGNLTYLPITARADVVLPALQGSPPDPAR